MKVKPDDMYLAQSPFSEKVMMDCPDLGCEVAIDLGFAPTVKLIVGCAQEHCRTTHGWEKP